MSNLTRTNWPLGWVPSDDPVNGNPAGLQRMDNLQQDEGGVLKLVRGLRKVNQTAFNDYPSDIWSANINNQEVLWAGLNSNGNTVYRSKNGNFSDKVSIANGTSRAIFATVLGQVIVCAGYPGARVKDNATTVNPLGLITPRPPVVTSVQQQSINLATGGVWSAVEGTTLVIFGAAYQIDVDTTTLRAVAQYDIIDSNGGKTIDTKKIGNGPSNNPNDDIFHFTIQPADTSLLTSVKVDVLLGSAVATADYFSYEWDVAGNQSTQFLLGQNLNSSLSARRGDFTRNGSDTTLDWTTVAGVRITCTAIAQTNFIVGNQKITGGIQGALNGEYQYVQVNINDNGIYVAKSEKSPSTEPVAVLNGFTNITLSAPLESQVNKIWLFRRSVNAFNPDVPDSFLDDYYLVATATALNTDFKLQDTMSDVDALRQNIKLNQFLQSLQNLGDIIYGMEGMYHDRMIYMGLSYIYFSDSINPDSIDTRLTIKVSGDPTEKNLFIRKITNNQLVLATSKDLYEINGTMNLLPDGTIDVVIVPIGEKYPPLSNDCAFVNGGLFYIAADGLRVTSGSNSQLLSPQLNLLFQGETRSGHPSVVIVPGNNVRYAMAVGKTKLYFELPLNDGTNRLFVYDLINKTYRGQYTDPVAIHCTQSDRVLLGYAISQYGPITFGDIYELDKGTGFQDSTGTFISGQPILFQTVYDANQQPRNRKDTFTLKLVCDTGGDSVVVLIDKDNAGVWTALRTFSHNGMSTEYIPLDGVTLGFRYAIRIIDSNLLRTFDLKEITIEYEPRPEQLDYMRILPTNLGTISRKRITAFAFVIDTLGNPISFTPYLDNVAWSIIGSVNNSTKLTYIFYFTSEAVATDIGGVLSGGVFEFYSVNLEECVSEKLPTPVEFLVIPANNYGTPNRKRHTSYKFQILTRGKNVQFTPFLDNIAHQPATFNTTVKQTVEYYFPQVDGDVIGIDVGGILASLESTPFEFYGVIVPQNVETLPPRLEYFRIPNSNLGVPARKRIRTLPMVIDTYGQNVTFTPIVDGLLQSNPTIFNTNGKITVYHYFSTDVFGTDFGGILQDASGPFEFYGLETPEDVEVLPVPKKLDQLGPIRFDKIGKIFGFRIRLISGGDTTIPYAIYDDNSPTILSNSNARYTGVIPVIPNSDNVYEVQLPKNINSTMCRLIIGPSISPFHRYDCQFKVHISGMATEAQWMTAR